METIEGLVRPGTWRDEFAGAAVRTTHWTTRKIGSGMSATVSGSKLTLATGTTSGDEIELTSTRFLKPPSRLYVVLDSISQRIANQEFSVEIVALDPETGAAGLPTIDGGNDRAGIFFDGTVNTSYKIQTWSAGDTQGSVAVTGGVATTTAQVLEIDLTVEEAWFYNSAVDVTTARSISTRQSRKVPDPQKEYYIRIRAKNTGVPASTTNFVIDSVIVEDYTHSTVEISRGRAGTTGGEQLPVQLVGTSAVVPVPLTTSGGVTTNHHLVSAATTNATLVKSAAGAIGSIVMANTSAAVKFVKLFNKVSAPTVGTDTPTVTFLIPAGATLTWDPALYYRMSNGIAYAITNLSPDLDATAVAAGDVIISINYL